MRRHLALFAAVLMLVTVPGAASASGPTTVDPTTLTPPPNPTYTWDCLSGPQGIDCTGVRVSTAVDVNPDPSFSCGERLILVTFRQTEMARRSHDSDGRVTRTHIVGSFDEQWRLEGTSGPTLTSRGRWSEGIRYAVPGDPTSRTITDTGITVAVSAPSEGVIFHTTGRVVFDADGNVASLAGPQAFMRDFEGAIQAVCEAFAG
jgi:hypothetical protein